jgi:hypothetical protein
MATAPVLLGEINMSDPDEMLKVTNNGKATIEWTGVRRQYVLVPGKPVFVPFHVCIRYLGDPRSEYRKTESFTLPDGSMGVIPERRGEIIRMSVFYGLYHDKIKQLPKMAPKVTVTRLDDTAIDWPIFNPDGPRVQYNTPDGGLIDARTEFERMRGQMAQMETRMAALQSGMAADDPEGGEATEDAAPGLL